MWMMLAREPKPDKPYWQGREWFAVIDALLWPLVLAVAVSRVDVDVGIVGPTAIALAVLAGIRRVHRAVWMNHRYRFTTWRWGKVVVALLLVGGLLKLLVAR